MPDSIDTYAAKTQLSRLLARVEAGEEITITRRGTPVAKLVPVTPKPAVVFGVLKGKFTVPDDFDDEDPELNALFYDEPIEPPK
jgi:prevent-host-death family protein